MWKWILPIAAGAVSLTAWIVFAVGLAADWEVPRMMVIATVGALGLEAAVWTTAAALGVTAFQARREIWRRLTGGFRKGG